MLKSRIAWLACGLFTTGVGLAAAADFSTYRGFRFGAKIEAMVKLAGAKPTDVRVMHTRPALIQEFTWRPIYVSPSTTKRPDPVQDGVLRFFNGDLFQMVITYDQDRIRGLSQGDLIEAISANYGQASLAPVEIPYRTNYGEVGRVLARWEDREHTYSLVRTGDQASYALIMTHNRLDEMAQAAIADAAKWDLLEAPQRAADVIKKQEADAKIALEKARLANKPNFRP